MGEFSIARDARGRWTDDQLDLPRKREKLLRQGPFNFVSSWEFEKQSRTIGLQYFSCVVNSDFLSWDGDWSPGSPIPGPYARYGISYREWLWRRGIIRSLAYGYAGSYRPHCDRPHNSDSSQNCDNHDPGSTSTSDHVQPACPLLCSIKRFPLARPSRDNKIFSIIAITLCPCTLPCSNH